MIGFDLVSAIMSEPAPVGVLSLFFWNDVND